jgi:hypothetical protein
VPACCYPWFNMGRVYDHQHHWPRAMERYRKAFEGNRQYTVAQHATGGYKRCVIDFPNGPAPLEIRSSSNAFRHYAQGN